MGIPDLLRADVAHVLVHVQPRSLSAGVDRRAGGMDRRRGGRAAARGAAPRPAGRRRYRRRGGRDRLPAQHYDPLPLHLVHGGFGLPGPRGVHHGPRDAPHRSAREIVHPADHGLRLQRARDHGLPDHRKPQQPPDNHTHYAVHVMQRANTDLPPVGGHVLRRRRRNGDAGPLRAGDRAGRRYGAADAAVPFPGGRDAVRDGAAALPPPDVENHAQPHVGQVCAVPQEDGRHDPDRFGHRVVFELLPPHGRRRRDRGALRKFLPRTARQGLRAGVQPLGIQLESRRVPAVGPPGQRDRGVDARRALLRRRRDRSRRGGGRDRRCGRRDGNHRENGRSDAGKGIPDRGRGGGGLALAAAARERRLHDGLGAGVPRLHPALHALHRHGGRHRRRSRVEMGCGVGGLQHDAGLVRGVDRISDRTDILNDFRNIIIT